MFAKADNGGKAIALPELRPGELKSDGDIMNASVSPSVRPHVMLYLPKPLGRIQPNLIFEIVLEWKTLVLYITQEIWQTLGVITNYLYDFPS